ncbi:MAG: hypothetical protein V4480_00960 [Patescibacteria group bacterium]
MAKLIFYIIVGLLVLSFFGVSLQHLVQSPTTQGNFSYFWDLIVQGWNFLTGTARDLGQSFGFGK